LFLGLPTHSHHICIQFVMNKQMNKYITLAALSFLNFSTSAQDFKLDNVKYQTISWGDFLKKLENNPDLIYYDIRSKGERNDSSPFLFLNQGKIRGAIETDFDNFAKFYPEYLKHKNDTIYLYCSHSRRSRYLASQLMDSSFMNVVNINGGLSYFNTLTESELPEKKKYYTNNLNYTLVSPREFLHLINNDKVQLIDVRPDSLYFGITGDQSRNLIGRIDAALHIPYDKLKDRLKLIDKNKTILLVDNDGNLSPIASNDLSEKGYRTSVLLFGLDYFVNAISSSERAFLKTAYPIITPDELLEISDDNTVLIDIRTEAEYADTDKTNWRSAGRLKNAVNIPLAKLDKAEIARFSGKRLVIYNRYMGEELVTFAKKLEENNIHDFYILAGGISQVTTEIYDFQKTKLKSFLED
jgi:rhodanese-related sulfurtransferase